MLKNTIALIPARYASTRLPAKPLADIAGKSMIQRVYEQTAKAISPERVWVATDDERIFGHVSDFGGRAVMTHSQHQSGTERCAEALLLLQKTIPNIGAVINVQGDEPFLEPQQIEELTAALTYSTAPIATLIQVIKNEAELFDTNRPKVVVDRQQQALYFSRQTVPFLRGMPPEQWLEKQVFYKHIGLYAYRPDALLQIAALPPCPLEQAESLEQLRWLWAGFAIQTAITTHDSFSVDVPEDVEKAIILAQKQQSN